MGFTVRPDSTMAEFIGEVCHPLPAVLHSRLGINVLEYGVGSWLYGQHRTGELSHHDAILVE